jgi:hypothetical protein
VKVNSIAPLLLFNEADAVIGKRKDVNNGQSAAGRTSSSRRSF